MFTPAKLKTAGTYLSRHLVANDYYAEGEKVTGIWMGRGAELLGLTGLSIGAKNEAFEALRTNRNPRNGERLTQRTGEKRIAFHDWQVSAPKSVSILAVTFGDERLRRAHEEAVTAAFAELERYAARRVREGEKANSEENVFTGNLVAAAFTHDASRALDAQLHTHLVCANATFDRADGRWYALQNREMFKAVELAGRIYQNELARSVTRLGYETQIEYEDGKIKGFEIVGVTVRDRDLQSTRRKQIEEEIEKFEIKHGRPPSAGERHMMATSTRNSKLAEITTAEVRANQLARYSAEDRERLADLVAGANAHSKSTEPEEIAERTRTIDAAIESTIEDIAERHAVFDARTVLAQVLRENPGVLGYQNVHDRLSARTADIVVALESPKYDPHAPEATQLLTTRDNLRLERESVAMVRDGQGRLAPLATDYQLSPNLTPDQRTAVEMILGSRDQFMALRGPAGTGKTTTLSSLDRVVQGVTGHADSIYVAPTHQAKGVLQRDGFKDATTVARLLVDIESNRVDLRGKLLVVDEAGMQSTKTGHALLCDATKAGARVLFVGDEKQIPAVEAGDFLAIVRSHGKMLTAELSTIFRQRENPEYLRAMEEMAKGNVKGSLEMLDRQGRVKEAGGNYLKDAATAYCSALDAAAQNKDGGDPATVALVAATWREIGQLTAAIREDRQAKGHLVGPEVKREVIEVHDHSSAKRRSESTYQPGKMVSPVNRSIAGLQKGEWSEVKSVGAGKITLANGKQIDLKKNGSKLLLGERKEIPLQVGDRILLQGNDHAQGLTNGTRGYVTGIERDGSIRFRESIGGKLSDQERTISAGYKTLTHGYALTVHASQGETVSRIIGAIGRAISGNLWNVLASRGRREVEIYVSDKQATIGRAATSIENRPVAMDYQAKEQQPEQPMPPLLSDAKSLTEARHKAASAIGARFGISSPALAARYQHYLANRAKGREVESA